MALWIECRPPNQRVTGSIPSCSTCLGCRQGLPSGGARGKHTLMFLSLSLTPSFQKEEKEILDHRHDTKIYLFPMPPAPQCHHTEALTCEVSLSTGAGIGEDDRPPRLSGLCSLAQQKQDGNQAKRIGG